MTNNIHIIKSDEGEDFDTHINFHYNKEERPQEGSIAFFTVYKCVVYVGWGEEGCQIPYNDYEMIYTVPFLFTEDTLRMMIQSSEERIRGLMEDDAIFVGVETHHGQMKEF